jgi:hypothetical protein
LRTIWQRAVYADEDHVALVRNVADLERGEQLRVVVAHPFLLRARPDFGFLSRYDLVIDQLL